MLVANNEKRQRFLRAAGALPMLERLTLTQDWDARGGPLAAPASCEGLESPAGSDSSMSPCVAVQTARMLALLAAHPGSQVLCSALSSIPCNSPVFR